MKQIIYKDKLRDVVIIHNPSKNYLMFDLSEYDKEEQEYYEREFKKIHEGYLQEVRELGLNSNYRYFTEDKIEWVQKDG